ncbi:A/G-specific adenine glycosylase [Geoalkalibacter halelectricus]|uniref:Adenine DNA glycosylase n=1 Tax=Geoalkalibacter halelectricus TaxID=2847045 RepID=A0ABY5ZFU4_9BACT|nr:A/G-specific adenine glycosylase [Geoalkalibacter halelectricus]MDO3378125.1 A/G-specific adenine glycosylase [Geoalkalibacter halelectricus]UWZ77971.1 A/G-specific adenine glycosylase [Geoalkalibacter halelectricus]
MGKGGGDRAAAGSKKSAASSLPFDPTQPARRLLAWYGAAGRDLPWRRTRDPYRIWLSEVMLQQTTVEAVVPYYERFLQALPDVRRLAAASLDEVIALWAGLGYYSRARNLHAAARRVVAEHGGIFPADLDELLALPGIGRSTAGAILSIAFDRPAPILDGNVRRVLCRLFALEENPRAGAAEKQLWAWAAALTPADHPHDYAQAIMDLGATLCVPRRPDCPRCPLADLCRARALGLAEKLPLAAAKRKVPEVVRVALVIRRGDEVLVWRRPYRGLLGGLWEFPDAEVAAGGSPDETAAELAARQGATGVQSIGGVRHAYSHFRLDLRLYAADLAEPGRVAESDQSRWVAASALNELPLHGAHKKALRLVAGKG